MKGKRGKTIRTQSKIPAVSYEEILLSHYDSLPKESKKLAKNFFKENYKNTEDFKELNLEEAIQQYLFKVKEDVPFPGPLPGEESFTFIDLFAGIGGFRMALQNLGGRCVFSSEYDKFAQQTYRANYGDIPFGDITKKETKDNIPEKFDILCGGFPCQPFSIAGVTKKNSLGRKHGFEDEKQGNLFFHVAEIIEARRPKAFFLENVKNLVSHDKGNTFKVIKDTIDGLGYSFESRVLDGKHFVPQHRERTIMVGFDKKVFGDEIKFDFDKVTMPDPNHKIREILEKKPDPKYTLTEHLWKYLQDYSKKHKEKGNGFGFGLVSLDGISRTMSARYYKDGAEILIPQKDKTPRRLTIRESARLQGYPDKFITNRVSMNQGYKQFGNSVVVPLIQSVGKQIVTEILKRNGKNRK